MKYKEIIYNYIPIKELKSRNVIRNRSYNSLLKVGIYTVQDINKHYLKYKTFKNIKNIGELSNKELVSVVEKYPLSDVNLPLTLNKSQESYFKEFIFFTDLINYEFPLLDKSDDFNYVSILNYFTSKEDDILETGDENTIMQFYILKHYVYNFINSISQVSDSLSQMLIYIMASYNLLGYDYSKLNLENIFKPFKLIYDTFKNEVTFSDKKKEIFESCFTLSQTKLENKEYDKCLRKLSKNLKISSERIRQLRIEIYYKFIDFLKVSFLFKEIISEKYDVDFSKDLVYIDRNKAKYIRETEGIDHSNNFINLIIYSTLSKDYDLVGFVRHTFFLYNFYFRNNSFYSIKKYLTDLFDFNAFIKKVSLRYKTAIRRDEVYDLEKYVKDFFKAPVSSEIKEKIYEILKVILENDYNIKVQDKKIIFKRTSKETLPELIYKILKEKGTTMKIEEIYHELKKSGRKVSMDSIRSTIVTDKTKFVSFNRNSTYAVREIVEEKNIKAGTIRKIVIEYLEKFDKPVSLDNVVEYVKKYRPTASRSSIISNLKLDSSNIFVFYKNKTMGLSYKPYYNPEDKNLLPTKWEKNYKDLLEFLKKNKRFPKLNLNDKKELTLYKFCRLNALLYKNKKLDEVLYERMKKINFDFNISKWPYLKK